ncbi:MAG: bifunctional 4-hydroxy-2-oxoglutarate aldolase/2-dehydro-3-deoxy-phosphogluconate aldolase [Bifidobacteriaceae bacterium]|jgi:2-dehydro-3-deoxyphosphogluconate aldolase/(4S)-4-hydroxy-2-oxoglutarate aldolase|nr:bifunctional 4-hydroxy-2-oxoglutarate aldolase/2-dehydro-3-deoxy-phosphogluconate aldolase [Bifidobacteriaceae bacterium]
MPQIRSPLVPVVVLDDAAQAAPLADALIAGGLPIVEITLRTPAGLAAIERLADRGDISVGAGTVLNPDQLDQALDAGAEFIVSPGSSPALMERAASRQAWLIPGAATASEILQVLEWGMTEIKFFPAAASGGKELLKALAAPFRQVHFIPTGGIGPANLAQYLSLSCVSAVGGSWMVPRRAITEGDFAGIKRLVSQAAGLAAGIVAEKNQRRSNARS